jgi:hypothetical protein
MTTLSPGITSSRDYSRFIMDDREFSTSLLTRVETAQKQDKDITLITAEGDKVTISSESFYHSTSVTYDRLIYGKVASTSIQGENYRFEKDQNLSIAVEGDLSKEELEGIKKLLNDLDKVMRDFLAGDIDKATASALKIGTPESISCFEASLQYERSLSMEQQVTAEVTSSFPATGSAATPANNHQSPEQIAKVADRMAGIIQNAGMNPGKAIKAIEKYFSDLFDSMSERDSPDFSKLKTAKKIRSVLLNKIRQLHEKPEPKAALES